MQNHEKPTQTQSRHLCLIHSVRVTSIFYSAQHSTRTRKKWSFLESNDINIWWNVCMCFRWIVVTRRYCAPWTLLVLLNRWCSPKCYKCYLLVLLFVSTPKNRFIGFSSRSVFIFLLLFLRCCLLVIIYFSFRSTFVCLCQQVNFMENIYMIVCIDRMKEQASEVLYYIDKQATIMFMHQYVPAATCSCLLSMFFSQSIPSHKQRKRLSLDNFQYLLI